MASEFQVAEHHEAADGSTAEHLIENAEEHLEEGVANLHDELNEEMHHPDEHGEGPFPPFDPEFFVPQLIWLVISFAILYVAMSRIALPRVGGILESRRERIAGDLDKAAELQEQTDEAIAAYEKALADARATAHGIAGETRDQMKAETDALRAEADAKIDEQLAAAEARISDTKDKALAGVREVASETAVAIIQRLTGEQADATAVVAAVDGALEGSR